MIDYEFKDNLGERLLFPFFKAISSFISKELESSKEYDLRGNFAFLPIPNSKSKHFMYFFSLSPH